MSLRSVINPVYCIIVISIFVSSLFKLLRMTTKVLTVEGGGKGLKCGVNLRAIIHLACIADCTFIKTLPSC